MKNSSSRFYEKIEWKIGDEGQKLIESIIKSRGWWVIPSYDFSGTDREKKTPRMFGDESRKSLILPDLDVSRNGQRFWMEVKTKREPTWSITTKTLDHGFSYHHFKDYLKIHEETGCRVFVLFLEYKKIRILGQWLDVLAPRGRWSKSEKMGEMIYFPIETMLLMEWDTTGLTTGLLASCSTIERKVI